LLSTKPCLHRTQSPLGNPPNTPRKSAAILPIHSSTLLLMTTMRCACGPATTLAKRPRPCLIPSAHDPHPIIQKADPLRGQSSSADSRRSARRRLGDARLRCLARLPRSPHAMRTANSPLAHLRSSTQVCTYGSLQPTTVEASGPTSRRKPPTFNIRIQRWAKGGRSYTRHAWTVLAETDNDLATPFLPYRMW
jgi:hypothetical protein